MADTLLDFFEALLRRELGAWLADVEADDSAGRAVSAGLRTAEVARLLSGADTAAAAAYIEEQGIRAGPKVTKPAPAARQSSHAELASVPESEAHTSENATEEYVAVAVVKTGGKSGKATAGKGARPLPPAQPERAPSPAPAPMPAVEDLDDVPPPFMYADREYAPWELACIEVLQRLKRHEYIDPRRSGCIGDFFRPVVKVFEEIREDYLGVIKEPMDLGTLEVSYMHSALLHFTSLHTCCWLCAQTQLLSNALLDAETFLEKMLLVFNNAVLYNEGHSESEYAIKLTRKCRHLVEYCSWLAYELLPLKDDSRAERPESMGELRESLRSVHRERRVALLKQPYYTLTSNKQLGGLGVDINDCNKLLKDLERRSTWGPNRGREKKSVDKWAFTYFIPPVNTSLLSDYSVYVRKPMDITTIRAKLEPPSGPPKYNTYQEFVEDLRLVFSNAVAYNRVHEATDTTGLSVKVLSAALHFQVKLESLYNTDFTVDVADKIVKDDIESSEIRRKRVSGDPAATWQCSG